MADKIEMLYESDLWDKSGECELLLLAFDGDHLYGRDKREGRSMKIRIAPRKFRRYLVRDTDQCRMVYFSTRKGYHIRNLVWKEKDDEIIIDPEKWLAFAGTHLNAAGDYPISKDLVEKLSGASGRFVFGTEGYMIHRDISGGDWGQDELVICYNAANVSMDAGEVFRIRIDSHTDLTEQVEKLMPTLRGNKWNERMIRDLVETLDTYDSNVYIDMNDASGNFSRMQIRMDGGKITEALR